MGMAMKNESDEMFLEERKFGQGEDGDLCAVQAAAWVGSCGGQTRKARHALP
jgi:hypothetical protein